MLRRLVADALVVPLRIAHGAVDDMQEDPRPLDVAVGRVSPPGARARPLDESGRLADRHPRYYLLIQITARQLLTSQGRDMTIWDMRDPADAAIARWIASSMLSSDEPTI